MDTYEDANRRLAAARAGVTQLEFERMMRRDEDRSVDMLAVTVICCVLSIFWLAVGIGVGMWIS